MFDTVKKECYDKYVARRMANKLLLFFGGIYT